MIPHDDLEQRLKLIEQTAPGLRAAGVMTVEMDGFSVRLAPPYGPADAPVAVDAKPAAEPAPEPEIEDALDDPATYGTDETPGYPLDEENE